MLSNYIRILSAVLSLLLCCTIDARRRSSSAGGRSISTAQKKGKKFSAPTVNLHEAKLVDIPIPLSSVLISDGLDSADSLPSVFSYDDKKETPEQLKVFFLKEMERLGWLAKECYQGATQMMLRFKKPSRSAVFVIRSAVKKGPVNFTVFTGSSSQLDLPGQ